jgi:hypothetical protein
MTMLRVDNNKVISKKKTMSLLCKEVWEQRLSLVELGKKGRQIEFEYPKEGGEY